MRISMDGRGRRALDNIFVERLWRSVKCESIYLKAYDDVPELLVGLTEYFELYNSRRPHQSLGYATPDQVYRSGVGGGAYIVDKYPKPGQKTSEGSLGQRQSAATEEASTSLN